MALELSRSMLAFVASDKLFPSGFMHVPFVSLVNDTTVRLRDNGMMCCLRVDGLNAGTLDERELLTIRNGISSVLGQMGENFSIYVHKIGRRLSFADFADPISGFSFSSELDKRWQRDIDGRRLRDKSLTISVVHHGPKINLMPTFKKGAEKLLSDGDERRKDGLGEVVRFLRSALGDVGNRLLDAPSGDLLGFLRSIMTGIEYPVLPAAGLGILADTVVGERVTFDKKYIEFSEGSLGERFGLMRAFKAYPEKSWVTMLDGIVMPCDYVITHSFSPIPNKEAVAKISRQRKVMKATDDVRTTAAENLKYAHEQAENRTLALGNHQATIMLIDPDKRVLQELASELDQEAQSNGITLVQDTLMRRAHFYSQLPGNQSRYRVRESLVTNGNMADFGSLHRTDTGLKRDNVPWGTPITAFPTTDGSLRAFNFHDRGSPNAAPSPGHTVVFGKTGSGKSVLINFLIAQAVRAGARAICFDYRAGLEMGLRAMGGRYSVVQAGEPTNLNPLRSETDEEGVAWLSDWLGRIVSGGKALSAVQARRVYEVCVTNASAPAELQVWHEFAQQFNMTDDGGELRNLVDQWGPEGRYGWVFGKSDDDNFNLDGDIVGFDLTQILDAEGDAERQAVLSYMFRRLERKLSDGRPTLIVIDEAWKAVDNPYFAEKIKGWLVTLRKLNAVVVMMAQAPAQFNDSLVGTGLYSSFVTQVIFPNPAIDPEQFKPLQLNNQELSIATSAAPGRPVLVRDASGSAVLDGDLSGLGSFVHILGGGTGGEAVVGRDWRDDDFFWKKGLDA